MEIVVITIIIMPDRQIRATIDMDASTGRLHVIKYEVAPA